MEYCEEWSARVVMEWERGHCTRHTNDEWDEARDCVYSWMVTKKVQYDFQWRIFNSPLHSVTTILLKGLSPLICEKIIMC